MLQAAPLAWDVSMHLVCAHPLLLFSLTCFELCATHRARADVHLRRSMHAAKQLGARLESAPPARVGPLDVSGDARWDVALKRLPLDDYHYIYVCRKRGA